MAQSKVTNLVSDLALKVSSQQLTDALAAKQNVVTDDSLEVRHVRLLRDALDSKAALLSDVQGTGLSLILGAKLRKIFGHGGIAVTHSLNQQNVSDPDNFQLKVSGAELQSSIATLSSTVAGVQQSLTALTQANSYLPTVGPASFTGNLQVESLKITNVLLTPHLLAPTAYVDMNIRNYGNWGD